MFNFKRQRALEPQETLRKCTIPTNLLLFERNQKVLIENWWMERGTSDAMLAFTESYRISLGKSNKNWLIFGNGVIWIAKAILLVSPPPHQQV